MKLLFKNCLPVKFLGRGGEGRNGRTAWVQDVQTGQAFRAALTELSRAKKKEAK